MSLFVHSLGPMLEQNSLFGDNSDCLSNMKLSGRFSLSGDTGDYDGSYSCKFTSFSIALGIPT